MRALQVYTAGPFGFSEAGRKFHTETFKPMLKGLGFEILDPWELTPQSEIDPILALPYGPERKAAWQKLNRIIGERNERAIIKADLITAVLDGTDVDSGTAAEIGFAAALRKTIFGYRGDFRLSADNEGSKVNLQVEYFIRKNGGNIASSLDELRDMLKEYLL